MGSCEQPTPGNPALLNEVLSVPPVARLLVVLMPPTPKSAKSMNSGRRGRFRRAENARAANAPGAGIHVEVDIQLLPFGLGLFGGAEVLFHVSQRAEQSFLFATPQRHPDGAPRL